MTCSIRKLTTLALAALAAGPAAAATATKAAAPPAMAAVRVTEPAAPAGLCARVDVAPQVQIAVGKSTVLRPATPLKRILLGNPDNASAARPAEAAPAKDGKEAKDAPESRSYPSADNRPGVAAVDVLLLAPTEVYLLGKTIGSTNVVMLDASGTCTAFDVVVALDTAALQAQIAQLLPEEKQIKVGSAFDSIVLSGMVSDSEALLRVTDLAAAYVRGSKGDKDNPRIVNMLSVAAPQQVMLEVKVAEISKSLLDAFGINFSRAFISGNNALMSFFGGVFGGAVGTIGQISGTGPNGVPLSSVGTAVGGTVPLPGVAGGNVTVTYNNGIPTYTTSYGTVPGHGVSNGTLNMQKTDGLVKVLAEPTVMAISGQTGSFLAGGTIFIPVAQNNGSGGNTVSLVEKEYGVSVKFTPTVLGNGRINLRVRDEVSDLNPTGVQISAGGFSSVLPTFTSRKAETTVQLMDGQSFAIGGLVKNNTTTSVAAFPFLGELPILGALFRSTQFQTDKSELVFVVTPRLVKPLEPGYRLPTDDYVPPTRGDLILHGRIEGERPDAPAAGGFDTEKK